MEIEIIKDTLDNNQKPLRAGEVYSSDRIGRNYAERLCQLGLAQLYVISPRMEKETLHTPKKVYQELTKKELQEQAKDLPGYKSTLKKAELLELLKDAD